MTDVKINVSANVDFGGVTSAMDKIRSSGEQPIKIGIDNKEAISNIDEVAKAQDAARIKASGTTSASSSVETPAEIIRKREMRQYKEYNDEVRRHFNLKRDVTELEYKSYQASANRMAKSGSSLGVFASASNGDARALAGLSPEAFRHAVANTGIIGKQPAERGGSSGAYGGKLASGLAGMAGGAIMGGTGGDGASAAGGALGGMIGAALPVPGGAFIGSMLGSMAGGAIGGSVGSAKDEAVGVSDLRHMLGETKTDFDLLRDSTRAAATGLGIAYGESVKLARQFAQTSSAQNGDSLGAEVRIASGLARSLGLDPSSGVGVMGTLRNTRATEDEAGSRRMAMVIADAINKGGMSSKSDEVMSAIANFAQTTARTSLQTPNVTGYSDFMARIVGTKTPGLDVQGSASMMGQMDQAVRSHGNINTDIFKQASISKFFPGMNSLDLDLMTNQGAMGTMEEVIKDLAKGTGKRGKWAKGQLENGNLKRPIQDMLMEGLKQFDTKDNESMYEQQGASLFRLSHTQFKKFSDVWKSSGSTTAGMGAKMSAMGIDPDKLDPIKYARIGALMGSNGADLQLEGTKLISGKEFDKNLSTDESGKLSRLMEVAKKGGDSDVKALRDEVIRLNASRGTMDEGQSARKDAEDIKNAIIGSSEKLLAGVVGVQDVILAMAGEGATSKLRKYQENKAMAASDDKIDAEAETLAAANGAILINAGTPQQTYIAKSEWARQQKEKARAEQIKHARSGTYPENKPTPLTSGTSGQGISTNGDFTTDVPPEQIRAMLRAEAIAQGVPPEVALAVGEFESGGFKHFNGPSLPGGENRGDRARGPMQLMGKTANGLGVDRMSLAGNLRGGVKYIKQLHDRYGSWDSARSHYAGAGKRDLATGMTKHDYVEKTRPISVESGLTRSSFNEGSEGQVVTIIVRSAENKFYAEKVVVKLHGRPQSSVSGARHSSLGFVA